MRWHGMHHHQYTQCRTHRVGNNHKSESINTNLFVYAIVKYTNCRWHELAKCKECLKLYKCFSPCLDCVASFKLCKIHCLYKSCGFRWLFWIFSSFKFLLNHRLRPVKCPTKGHIQRNKTHIHFENMWSCLFTAAAVAAKGKNITVGNRNLWKKNM